MKGQATEKKQPFLLKKKKTPTQPVNKAKCSQKKGNNINPFLLY